MKKRIGSALMVFVLLLSAVSGTAYAKEGLTSARVQTAENTDGAAEYASPSVKPPLACHPRIYFTSADIPKIKENLTNEENKYALRMLKAHINSSLTSSSAYSDSKLSAIESRAFYYAVTKDSASGAEAHEWVGIIKAMKPEYLQYRRYGRMINVLSEVYDWCYDVLSDEEKSGIVSLCLELAAQTEVGWPPTNQRALTGHGSEFQLLRDLLSFAIAVYDERPDIWEMVGGRFYEEYVPAAKFTNSGHYNMQGTNYGYYRESAISFAYALITGMGAAEPFPIDDMVQTAMSEIYLKRPDGNIFGDGDIYMDSVPPFSYYSNETNSLLIRAMKGKNGFLKGEYMKETLVMSYGTVSQSFQDQSPVMFLILNDPALEAETANKLPLSKYYSSPVGMMTARTGFSNGENSDSAAVMMKFGEYMLNNHQQLDCGSFQIYYKGLLAAEGGSSASYEDSGHNMFTRKSAAHNTVLIDDPNEVKLNSDGTAYVSRSNVNDGGQKPPNSYAEYGSLEELFTDPNAKRSEVTAHEIDPSDTQSPAYSYMKGELSGAYSDKVTDFERSFMFLNFGDEEIPAALIVFDRVCSSDERFKKSWLLHGVNAPTVGDGIAEFRCDSDGYGGKMEVKTLLPTFGNLEATVVDGPTVKGYKYDVTSKTWTENRSETYETARSAAGSERNTHRLQLSPKTASKEDYFFNVLTVGDCQSLVSSNAELFETNTHYGTIVKDRAVFFGKGKIKNDSFSVALPSGRYKYTVCDMKKGTYSITTESGTVTASVSEEGGVLAFESAGGTVAAAYINDTYTAPIDKAENVKENVYYIKDGERIAGEVNVCNDYLGENETVFAAAAAESMGLTARENGEGRLVIYDGENRLAEITAGVCSIVTKSGVFETEVKPQIVSGQIVMKLSDLLKAVFRSSEISKDTRLVFSEKLSSAEYAVTTTAYNENGELTVCADLKQGFSADLICGIFKDSRLVSAKRLVRDSDGIYRASFSGVSAGYEVKIFPWTDGLKSFGNVIVPHSFGSSLLSLKSRRDGTVVYSDRGFTTVTKQADRTVVSKRGTKEQASAQTDLDGFILGDDGYLLYSTAFRVLKKSCDGEKLQLRLRNGTDTSKYTAFTLPSAVDSEFRLCVIGDLKNKKVYVYIDGKQVGESTLEAWGNSEIGTIEFFFTNGLNEKGGSFEVFDDWLAKLSGTIGLDEIILNLNCIGFDLNITD